MITRSIDNDTHDWNFGKGKQDYLQDSVAIQQNIKTKLLSFSQNCFFDMGEGIDWISFLGTRDLQGMQEAIAYKIASIYGVTNIKTVEINNSINREVSVKYAIKTIWDANVRGSITL